MSRFNSALVDRSSCQEFCSVENLRTFQCQQRPAFCRPASYSEEPSIYEVLEDPIVNLLMVRDGVRATTLVLLIRETRQRLLDHAPVMAMTGGMAELEEIRR